VDVNNIPSISGRKHQCQQIGPECFLTLAASVVCHEKLAFPGRYLSCIEDLSHDLSTNMDVAEAISPVWIGMVGTKKDAREYHGRGAEGLADSYHMDTASSYATWIGRLSRS
jgi:hypothetical protein